MNRRPHYRPDYEISGPFSPRRFLRRRSHWKLVVLALAVTLLVLAITLGPLFFPSPR